MSRLTHVRGLMVAPLLVIALAGCPTFPVLVVSPAHQSGLPAGGTKTFAVVNAGAQGMRWTASVTSGNEWLSITSGDAGTDAGSVAVSYAENATTGSRTATVTIAAPGVEGSSATVTLVQDGRLVDTVDVPAGTFVMGALDEEHGPADELPRHNVTLDPYAIGLFEVTSGQYAEVLNWALTQGRLHSESGGSYTGGDVYSLQHALVFIDDMCPIRYADGRFIPRNRDGYSMADHPISLITWYGAVAFCNWLSEKEGYAPCYDLETGERIAPLPNGYRLPTEAEWERAAAWDPFHDRHHWMYAFQFTDMSAKWCNYGQNNPLSLLWPPLTTPVGYYDGLHADTEEGVSPVGCYDLSGNLAEWCHDWYSAYTTEDQTNPAGPASVAQRVRVIRGGAYSSPAADCRSAARDTQNPELPALFTGFRVAKS